MNTQQKSPVYILGALNLDVIGIPTEPLQMADSNPGRVTLLPGGVGHNIALSLVRAGFAVELVSLLGDDYAAGILSRYCGAEGIGLRHTTRNPGPSSSYLSLMTDAGDLLAAINDMSLMDLFSPAHVQRILPQLNLAPLVILDANLPQDALEAAATGITAPMLLDPVSGFKAVRAYDVIGRFAAVKPNLLEAETLSGMSGPENAADWFLAQGTRQVYISLGAQGVYYAGEDSRGILSAPPMRVQSCSGAGDAMTAGIAAGILRGLDIRACASQGIDFSTRHLQQIGGIVL